MEIKELNEALVTATGDIKKSLETQANEVNLFKMLLSLMLKKLNLLLMAYQLNLKALMNV